MQIAEWMIGLTPVLATSAVFLYPARVSRGVWFGVSVPVEFPDSPTAKRMQSTYRLRTLIVLAIAIGLAIVGLARGVAALLPISVVVELMAGVALWVLAVRSARPYAIHPPLTRTATLDYPKPDVISRVAQMLAFLPLALSALYLRQHWFEIPERFPQRWDSLGRPDAWAARTTLGVFAPLLIGLGILIFLYVVQAFLKYGPGRAAIYAQPVIASVAWLIALVFSLAALMPVRSHPGQLPELLLWVIAFGSLGMFAMILRMVWKLARAPKPAYDGTPDAAWHAGLYYYNRADSALFVPKRLGYGWTLNFAHPMAWVFIAVALSPVVLVLIFYIAR